MLGIPGDEASSIGVRFEAMPNGEIHLSEVPPRAPRCPCPRRPCALMPAPPVCSCSTHDQNDGRAAPRRVVNDCAPSSSCQGHLRPMHWTNPRSVWPPLPASPLACPIFDLLTNLPRCRRPALPRQWETPPGADRPAQAHAPARAALLPGGDGIAVISYRFARGIHKRDSPSNEPQHETWLRRRARLFTRARQERQVSLKVP